MENERILALDFSSICTKVLSESEARALPVGAIVGDRFGGRSFNDNVAAVLETRSLSGWFDVVNGGISWTVICLVK